MRTPRGFRKLTVIDLPARWRQRYGGRSTSLGAMASLTCVARARIYPGTSIISSTSRSFWLSSSRCSSTSFSGWSSCCCRCLALSKEKPETRLRRRGRRRTDDRRVEKDRVRNERCGTKADFFHVKVIEKHANFEWIDRNKSPIAESLLFTRTIHREKSKSSWNRLHYYSFYYSFYSYTL